MQYTPTDVAGVTIIDIEPHRDYRGFFSCSFCADEFAECGLNSTVAQTNISFNYTRGTLRGLHRQMPPYAEAKLVRAVAVPLSTLPSVDKQIPESGFTDCTLPRSPASHP